MTKTNKKKILFKYDGKGKWITKDKDKKDHFIYRKDLEFDNKDLYKYINKILKCIKKNDKCKKKEKNKCKF